MYNLKRDTSLYIYYSGVLHQIELYSDVSVSQTLAEQEHSKKTLHNLGHLYKGASITEANPANFSFTSPVRDPSLLLELVETNGTDSLPSFDIYIATTNTLLKLTKCAIENITLNIDKTSILTMSVSGSASVLEFDTVGLPTTPVLDTSDPYVIIRGLDVQVNGIVVTPIAAVNIDINNDIQWIKSNTLHSSLANNVAYPEFFVVTERRISGSITEFLTSTNYEAGVDHSVVDDIVVRIYSEVGESPPFLTFNLPQTVFTRRLSFDELVTRVYDFRLTSNEISVIPQIRS